MTFENLIAGAKRRSDLKKIKIRAEKSGIADTKAKIK
jgi:hypothetical protein